jgi:phosphatidate phosphatase APP1
MSRWRRLRNASAADLMPRFRDVLRLNAVRTVRLGKRVAEAVWRRGPIEIAAYRGYGSRQRVYLHGRVLARPGYSKPTPTDPIWRNVVNIYRRADSDPIPFAKVQLSLGSFTRPVDADDEGFFGDWLELPAGGVDGDGWVEAKLELLTPRPSAGAKSVSTAARVLIPPGSARFGVISDIDDTLIQSRVSSFIQAVRTVMLGNALTRLPFKGVAEFYSALHAGMTGSENNPLFYVSSSPWNIYDVIEDFLTAQGIPHGPLLLRDWDFGPRALSSHRQHHHKGDAIREILETYPTLPFILIGDSSQQDPEIYHRVVHDFPERIIAVYIRDVERTTARTAAISGLAKEVEAAGSTLLLVQDTFAAATHAAGRGWIAGDKVETVAREAAADSGQTAEKEPAPM